MKKNRNRGKKNVQFLAAAALTAALMAGQIQPLQVHGGSGQIQVSSLIPDNVTIDQPVPLSSISLPGSDYGTLSWVDSSSVPSQRVQSYDVVFRPYNSSDLPKISGWDGVSDAIYGTVTVVVNGLDESQDYQEENQDSYEEENWSEESGDSSADNGDNSGEDTGDSGEWSEGPEEDGYTDAQEPGDNQENTEEESGTEDTDASEGSGSEVTETPDGEETESSEDTDKKDPALTPGVTEAPEEGNPEDKPEDEETPEPTVTPEITEQPEATVTPEITETPEATVTPEITEQPEATEAPEKEQEDADPETEAPEITPEATAAPEVTVTPEPTVTVDEDGNIFDRDENSEKDTRPDEIEGELTDEEMEAAAAANHSCNGISVSGINLPWYVQFRASSGEDYEFTNESEANIFKSYEFELWDLKNDTEYHVPDGEYISVTVPVKAGYDYTIEHLLDNGAMETIVPSVDGSTMVFSTHSFSPFGIAGSKPLVGEEIASDGYEDSSAQATVTPAGSGSSSASAGSGAAESTVSPSASDSDDSSQSGGSTDTGTDQNEADSEDSSDSAEAVNTGDTTPIAPFVVLAVAAVVIIAVIIYLRKRK